MTGWEASFPGVMRTGLRGMGRTVSQAMFPTAYAGSCGRSWSPPRFRPGARAGVGLQPEHLMDPAPMKVMRHLERETAPVYDHYVPLTETRKMSPDRSPSAGMGREREGKRHFVPGPWRQETSPWGKWAPPPASGPTVFTHLFFEFVPAF